MNDTTTNGHERPDAKILERIRRLLAMANDCSSPNEAAIAARRAQLMMEKYNIEESDTILADLKTAEAIDRVDVGATMVKTEKRADSVPPWAQDLAIGVAEVFDCHVVMAHSVLIGKCLRFIGYKTDTEVARWVFGYLLDQIRKLNHDFLVKNGRPGRAAAVSYRAGVIRAIKQGLREAKAAKDLAARGNSSSTALVVAKSDAIAKFLGYKPKYGTRKAKEVDAWAYSKGYSDGQKVNVNPTALTNKQGPSSPRLK